jgi:hypothetical protein
MSAKTPNSAAGPSAPIPSDDLYTFCFSNPFQHAPNEFVPHSIGRITPHHTFDGQPIPPQRPSLIHAGTGATLSWQRARADALRVARYMRAIVGDELSWDGKAGNSPVSIILRSHIEVLVSDLLSRSYCRYTVLEPRYSFMCLIVWHFLCSC